MAPVHATAPADKGSLAARQSELCFQCHPQQRAKLMLTSRHPVREGRMSCSSCHDPHGGQPGEAMIKTAERVNDLCDSCHASKQGPFIFEHQPVEESCLTCHDPHGTVANNLLKQGEPFVCLQCHEMHFHAARVTPGTPFYLPAGGSQNPNGVTGFQQAYNTKCTACHSRVHGSDLPSQGVTGRGKALTR
jgi:DmsE family decaheme c-type cytochrome